MIGSLIDAWRRLIPSRPRYPSVLFVDAQSEVPDALPRRAVVAVGTDAEAPKWAVFPCPCGTGHHIAVPLRGPHVPLWSLTRDAVGRPSLAPSVDAVTEGVRCHFWLRDGVVAWAPDRRRGRRSRAR
jgi:hypothetical protein